MVQHDHLQLVIKLSGDLVQQAVELGDPFSNSRSRRQVTGAETTEVTPKARGNVTESGHRFCRRLSWQVPGRSRRSSNGPVASRKNCR